MAVEFKEQDGCWQGRAGGACNAQNVELGDVSAGEAMVMGANHGNEDGV